MTTKDTQTGARKRHYVSNKLAPTGKVSRSGLAARLNIIYDKIIEDKDNMGMSKDDEKTLNSDLDALFKKVQHKLKQHAFCMPIGNFKIPYLFYTSDIQVSPTVANLKNL